MKYLLIAVLMFVEVNLFAASSDGTELQIDKDLVNTLYKETVTESPVETRTVSNGLTLTPQVSMFTPSQLTLTNNYFESPYAENLQGLPMLYVTVAFPLGALSGIAFYGQASVGYTYKEGVFSVQRIGGRRYDGNIKLHWLPLSVSSRVAYRIPGFSFLTPSLTFGGGAQWLYQSASNLDGFEQGFWVPFYTVRPALTFFDQSVQHSGDWFGGVTFGISYQSSVGSSQVVRGLGLDLGMNILL